VKIVVGLGNPGKRYEKTPHNAGFMTIDVLAGQLVCRTRRSLRFSARIGKTTYGGESVWLVKPQTFMNNSGMAVGAILRYLKIDLSDLIVVLDDADLPLGRLRVRPEGGSGGHRGLKSIIEHIGGGDFVRLRVGIGRDKGGRALVEHVLSTLSAGEQKLMEGATGLAARAVCSVLDDGVEKAMNTFNGMKLDLDK